MPLSRILPVAAFALAATVARGGQLEPVEAPKDHFKQATARREVAAEEWEMARAEFLEAAKANTDIGVSGLPQAAGAFAGRTAERATRAVIGRLREAMNQQTELYAGVLDARELRTRAKQLRQLVTLTRVADRVRKRRQAAERTQVGVDVRMLLAVRSGESEAETLGDAPPAVASAVPEPQEPVPADVAGLPMGND